MQPAQGFHVAFVQPIFVVLLIRSAGGGIQTPAVQSFIPDIVPSGKLLRVNSIYGVINSANMIVAPAVAAVLINMVPLWSILLIDVTTAVIGVGRAGVWVLSPSHDRLVCLLGSGPASQDEGLSLACGEAQAYFEAVAHERVIAAVDVASEQDCEAAVAGVAMLTRNLSSE